MANPGRLSINVIPATEAALQRMVEREGVTVTEAVRRLVACGDVLDVALSEGAELLVRRGDQLERLRLLL